MTLLTEGSEGQAVRNAQIALNYHLPDAKPPLETDGIFGWRTRARVVQFQRATGYLVDDGIIGPLTSEALYTFVDLSFHIISLTTPARDGGGEAAGRSAVFKWPRRPGNDWPRIDPFKLPPLRFEFPRIVPPLPRLPRLSLDPMMQFLRKRLTFDLGMGAEGSGQKNVSTGEVSGDLVVLADGRLTVWSRPIGRHLTMSGGAGIVVEQRLVPDPNSEISAYVFAKAEIKDIKKYGPLDIAKFEVNLQFGGPLGKNKPPPNLSTSVCYAPEVTALSGRFGVGIGGCVEYSTDGKTHAIGGKGMLSGTWHFK